MSAPTPESIPLPSADKDNWQLKAPTTFQALAALAADPDWELRAACKHADVGLFFPYDGTAESEDVVPKADLDAAERDAMKNVAPLCGSCVVRFACIGSAVQENSVGIRGATTTLQRQEMRRYALPSRRGRKGKAL